MEDRTSSVWEKNNLSGGREMMNASFHHRNMTPHSRSLLPGIPMILVVMYFISIGRGLLSIQGKQKNDITLKHD